MQTTQNGTARKIVVMFVRPANKHLSVDVRASLANIAADIGGVTLGYWKTRQNFAPPATGRAGRPAFYTECETVRVTCETQKQADKLAVAVMEHLPHCRLFSDGTTGAERAEPVETVQPERKRAGRPAAVAKTVAPKGAQVASTLPRRAPVGGRAPVNMVVKRGPTRGL